MQITIVIISGQFAKTPRLVCKVESPNQWDPRDGTVAEQIVNDEIYAFYYEKLISTRDCSINQEKQYLA